MARLACQQLSCSFVPTSLIQHSRGNANSTCSATFPKKLDFFPTAGHCGARTTSMTSLPYNLSSNRLLCQRVRTTSRQKVFAKKGRRLVVRASSDFDGVNASELFEANKKDTKEVNDGGIQTGIDSLPEIPADMDQITDEMRAMQPPGLDTHPLV